MEPESYKAFISIQIRIRVIELRKVGVKTSKGEPMSLSAIGRTLAPPVSRAAVYHVVDGRSESKRIKEAIERELEHPYWIRKKDVL